MSMHWTPCPVRRGRVLYGGGGEGNTGRKAVAGGTELYVWLWQLLPGLPPLTLPSFHFSSPTSPACLLSDGIGWIGCICKQTCLHRVRCHGEVWRVYLHGRLAVFLGTLGYDLEGM